MKNYCVLVNKHHIFLTITIPIFFFIAAIEESKNMCRIHAIENKYRIEITGRLCTKTELEAFSFFIFRQIIAVKTVLFFSARVVRNRKECKY